MVKDLCFEILDKCPNRCMFCSSNSCIDKNTFISLDDFKRVIDYFMLTGGIEELSLSGGEPLLQLNSIRYLSLEFKKLCKEKNITYKEYIKKITS